jgi:hypothetical protein
MTPHHDLVGAPPLGDPDRIDVRRFWLAVALAALAATTDSVRTETMT